MTGILRLINDLKILFRKNNDRKPNKYIEYANFVGRLYGLKIVHHPFAGFDAIYPHVINGHVVSNSHDHLEKVLRGAIRRKQRIVHLFWLDMPK